MAGDTSHQTKAVRVTITDPETCETLGEHTVDHDYLLICAGNRYLKSVQVMGRTHMLAVAVAKPGDRT